MENPKRGNYLSLALLECLEDENPSNAEKLLKNYNADPNFIVNERGIAPMHYVCGMENLDLSEKLTHTFLEYDGNPNLATLDDELTPLHIAAISGRSNIVRMLLEKGGNIDSFDKDNKTPLQYAVYERHFDVVQIMKRFEQKNQENSFTTNNPNLNNLNAPNNPIDISTLDDMKSTPNRINYNFDVSSPYYINITHRRKDTKKPLSAPVPLTVNETNIKEDINLTDRDTSSEKSFFTSTLNENVVESPRNLFELTEENLSEMSKNITPEYSRISLIKTWREKVNEAKCKRSVLYNFNNLNELLDGIMTDESIDFTNASIEEKVEEGSPKPKRFDQTSFGKLINVLRSSRSSGGGNASFVTAKGPVESDKSFKFIRSPKPEEFVFQMSEKYQHVDQDQGLIFFEEKLVMTDKTNKSPKGAQNNLNDLNKTGSTISTQFTVPTDYDTEALRAELTQFGEPPGPITKSTKRLYTKRLIKYRRDPQKIEFLGGISKENQNPNFSIELEKTVRNIEWYQRIPEYYGFENEMCLPFKNNHKIPEKKWREGNLKQSFIYLLIDPRVSQNLPGKSVFENEHEIWIQFLKSIFYVGKGKSIRPYSHLYEAMKIHVRLKTSEIKHNGTNNGDVVSVERLKRIPSKFSPSHIFNSPRKNFSENKKLERILDIWTSEAGVICLHVFHNILPAEAYTREAAIIDALGLQHLTNLKRGDYYGPAQSWTMRKRKSLGVALLLKAMKIFLAEGESQLFPSDLV